MRRVEPPVAKDRVPQTPGVRVFGVGDPAPDTPSHFVFGHRAVPPAVAQTAEAVAEAFLPVGAVDHPVSELQCAAAGDASTQVPLQDLVVDGGEVAKNAPPRAACAFPQAPTFRPVSSMERAAYS